MVLFNNRNVVKSVIFVGILATMAGVINNYAASGMIMNDITAIESYRYVIKDCYTSSGEDITHKVNHYTHNVNGSISFSTETGERKTIPYPYFSISTADGKFIPY